ncbi:MAG: PAS domain-containing protein, partial [Gammaproteobacteria bacterium]|nr:PAS domain-containing protein [Gammaproteobacteria bacterium]
MNVVNRDTMLNSISLLEQQLANAKQRISELESVVEELDFNSHILENMSEGINLVRPEDGIIVYTNKIFDQMFGYQPGELIGKHVDVLNAPDTSGNPAEVIASTLRNGNEWHGEINNTKKDGSTFWCYARVVKFD